MTKAIEYYFSLVSPWIYLGHTRLIEIAGRTGASISYRPVKLGKVFPATGGLPLGQRSQQRQDYRLIELERWGKTLNLPINLRVR